MRLFMQVRKYLNKDWMQVNICFQDIKTGVTSLKAIKTIKIMRLNFIVANIAGVFILSGCAHKATNPIDPFEPFNRKVHAFNTVFDNLVLRPPARVYKAVIPAPVRTCVNNFYTNLDMIPTVANDLLQAEGKWAIKDTWRFFVNSTLGVGGLFDVASKFSLPPHSNDLGLTLAKWGDKKSPYLVIPFLGPSTLRDGAGWLFQFAIYSPYVYIHDDRIVYGLLGLRYVDLRSQYLETDHLMDQALDKYTFLRDIYLQHRNYLINGTQPAAAGTTPAESSKGDPSSIEYVDE